MMAEPPVDHGRWQRVEAILDEVLELAAADRAAVLDRACAGDAELRAEVESLLAADAQSAGILETPAGEYAETLIGGPGSGTGAAPDPYVGRELGPYRVVRRIGAGGMGLVYEGRDIRLERRVAIKLLPPEWSRDAVAKERFLREARAASALDHPNICTVYDVGETDDGRLFLVMAYYEGGTLARKIAGGPLPVPQAVEVAIRIALGLERAHEAGITHRDVKPGNVMVTDRGEVKILDFGIAKIAGDAGLTQTGRSPGTPAYMSPEQAAGDAIDGRTDIWALGVVLYEMVAGRRPFRGEHEQAVIHSILSRQPEPLSRSRDGVTAALERTVTRALAKDPGERFHRVGQLRAALESGKSPATHLTRRGLRTVGAALICAFLVVAGWWGYQQRGPTTPDVESPAAVVGVVPFVNHAGDAALDWYGEAIASLVTDALAPSRHLQVVSPQRVAALATAAGPQELAQLAAGEGITVLITGEILPGPEGLSLAARLTDTEGGRQLAAFRDDGLAPEELLQAAGPVAREARKALGVPTAEWVDVYTADSAPENPEAYESYLKGLRALVNYRYDEAEGAFTAALDHAPGFTMARHRLALVLAATGRMDEAERMILQAAAEASRLPLREARYIRAAKAHLTGRYDEAIAEYNQILEDYPFEVEARCLLAEVLFATGEYEDQLHVLHELAQLEPQNHITWSLIAEANQALGDYYQATLALEKFLDLEPESANGHHLLADVYRVQNELDRAAEEYSAARTIDPGFHVATIWLAIVNVLRNQPDTAEDQLADLVANRDAEPRSRIHASFELASLYRSQGRFRKAAETLAALRTIIEGEKVREAMALAVRGTSRMELGDYEAADHLIDLAVTRSPGVPTRYLFARGLLELRRERFEAVDETVHQILQGALPPDDSDRTEDKAAAYLRGRRLLATGEVEQAIEELTWANTREGYEYASYWLGLAEAHLVAGQVDQAMAAAHRAQEPNPADPRVDLELDRHRALLVLARVKEAKGRPAEAAELARKFLARWATADPELPELDEARRLAEAE